MKIGNYTQIIKLVNKYNKFYLPICIAQGIANSGKSLALIYLPMYFLDNINSVKDGNNIIIRNIVCLLVMVLLLSIISIYIKSRLSIIGEKINLQLKLNMGFDSMEMEYRLLEDSDIAMKKEKAMFPIENQNVIPKITLEISNMITLLCQLIVILVLITRIHWILALIPFVVMYLNIIVSKKAKKIEEDAMEQIIPLNRRFGYYMRLIANQEYAKDMRFYRIDKLVIKKLIDFHKESIVVFKELLIKQGKYKGILNINLQLVTLCSCIGLMITMRFKTISVGEVSAIISAIISLSGILYSMVSSMLNYHILSKYMCAYFEFRDITKKVVESKTIKLVKNIESIEIEDVSFKYPRTQAYVLKNINMKFEKGKTYSIVGVNGAGKSTLVKIICNLFKEYEGNVKVNGLPLSKLSSEDFINRVSCLFQDFKIFPFTILENITLGKEVNTSELNDYINQIDKDKVISRMQYGMDTIVGKHMEKNGINLSGGFAQRIAIARALLKACDVMIMDEPTASIDPLMEFEIYKMINDLETHKKERTIRIYISHRMASCTMCDYIYVLDQGEVVQEGSFNDLVNENGKFLEMWEKQSDFYKKASI